MKLAGVLFVVLIYGCGVIQLNPISLNNNRDAPSFFLVGQNNNDSETAYFKPYEPVVNYRRYRPYESAGKRNNASSCNENPRHSSCVGTQAGCQANSRSELCKGTEIGCLDYPNDRRCRGTQIDCHNNPDRFECRGSLALCREEPSHESCAGTLLFCQKNQKDESCVAAISRCQNNDEAPQQCHSFLATDQCMRYQDLLLSRACIDVWTDTCDQVCRDESYCFCHYEK